MRIVGGKWGGRILTAPKGSHTRPTADGQREALFNILEHGLGHSPQKVLDFFAGTGALGIEALSRGAESIVFIENNLKTIESIKKNCAALGISDSHQVLINAPRLERSVDLLKKLPGAFLPFDTIFCDPPYGKGLIEKALTLLEAHANALFSSETVLVAETAKEEHPPQLPEAWHIIKDREKGATRLLFYHRIG